MSATVLHPGLHSMLVDTGRAGHRLSGIGPSGPMDSFAYQIGNFLTGNNDSLCAIEFFQSGPELLFHQTALVAITGPGSYGILDGEKVSGWRPLIIKKDSVLKLVISGDGMVGYLNIYGGWGAQQWLGSSTTQLSAGMGGYHGRLLQRSDVIKIQKEYNFKDSSEISWHISDRELSSIYAAEKHICCVQGPESIKLPPATLDHFVSQRFRVSPKSNRMGYRLSGEPLIMDKKLEMISSPVDLGTIQLLPDGQLVVLMADHQTTGGYPRLASVVHADIPRLAQFSSSHDLCFSWCTPDTAYGLMNERSKKINEIKNSCLLRLKPYLH